jgi:phage terminase large subunit-like protein
LTVDVEFPFCEKAEQYVSDVLSGKILVCKRIIQACQRHRRDLERIGNDDWPYYFDHEAAERATRFMTRFPHVKGRWAARPGTQKLFNPEPWQCFWFVSIFGWKRLDNGKRRFRRARLYVPRKNGKSLMVAPLGLYMLTADGEPGAEVFSGATNEKQAWEVFGPAKQMAAGRPDFCEHYGVEVNAKSLTVLGSMSKFEPVIGKPGDGANPHCSLTDEYHEHTNDDQLATFETGMGAREQPLSVVVSTAGDNIAGPCRQDWLDCEAMLDGTMPDEMLFALIYTIDDPEQWATEDALRMANPNYGVSIEPLPLVQNQQIAVRQAHKQGHFKIKHLNIWVQARAAYFNTEMLRAGADNSLAREKYAGRVCFAGMDLASKNDLASVTYFFPEEDGSFFVLGRHYLPRATVDKPENGLYRTWETEGWITVTEGNQTDYETIQTDIEEDAEFFELEDMGFDPHNATMLTTRLVKAGINMVEYGPTVLNFSEPMKELQVLIEAKKIKHCGDKVIEWCISNVVSKRDRKDNDYPNKEKYEKKIDAAVSLIMAVGRYLQNTAREEGDMDGFFKQPVVVR